MTNRVAELRLKPLQRLAPSRFTAAARCALREVLRANDAPCLLPTSGAAHIGTVVHKLLEEAAQNSAMSAAVAESRFDVLLVEEQQRMEGSPDEVFLPLASHVRDFGVRKRRAILAASTRSRTAREHVEGTAGRRATGPEVWVASRAGEVGGYIDDVVREGEEIVLRDYKSGMAAQLGTAAHESAVEQLQLYAALYYATNGIWPAAVEIVPIDGPPQREKVDRAACSALLERACALYRWTNSMVSTYTAHDAERKLACPAPKVCNSCSFRPLCVAYLAARQSDGEWPPDVIGTVKALNHLGNGKVSVQVEDKGVSHVRGITPDAGRHPEFPHLRIGVTAGLFNVKGRARHYEESDHTAIVLYEGVG